MAIIWHELITKDLATAQAFYGGLFGWKFGEPKVLKVSTFITASLDGQAIAGLLRIPDSAGVNSSQWLSCFRVPDVEKVVAAATGAGGRVLVKPVELQGRGRGALILDTEGAPFAVLEPSREVPWEGKAPVNGWLWNEFFSNDPAKAAAFYGTLFGFQLSKRLVDGRELEGFQRGGVPVASLHRIPTDGPRPNWLPTIRVADVEAVAGKVAGLGGRLIMPPRPDVRDGNVAIIADPSGAAFAVQEWSGSTSARKE
jgi:predicted enzyme related to lactoylglutathione lyase